jgi:hypothetical protein
LKDWKLLCGEKFESFFAALQFESLGKCFVAKREELISCQMQRF